MSQKGHIIKISQHAFPCWFWAV